MGGKGTMAGTLIGALVIATLRNGFTLLSISSAVQNMVLGLVIIAAVLLDVSREAMAAKARRKEAAARAYHDEVMPAMEALRAPVDAMEVLNHNSLFAIPTFLQAGKPKKQASLFL